MPPARRDADRRRAAAAVATSSRWPSAYGRPVRLLIVPGAQRLRRGRRHGRCGSQSSEVYVGESATLSADDQARLLGDAWERADKPEPLDVRLVIHHRSGRADTYHLGAHPPALTPGDLDLIHRALARRRQGRRPARASPRRRPRGADTNGTTTERPATRRGARGDPRDGAAGRRARRGASRARLRAAARHAAQPPRRATSPTLLTELQRSKTRCVVFRVLPRKDAAAVVRVPVAGRAGSAAQGDGAGGRRGAAEQHGAGRSHDVPRGAAGRPRRGSCSRC